MANGVAVAVPVGVAGGDRPGEALVVAGRGDGDDRGAVGGGLGEVGRGVRDGGATSVIVIVMSSVSGVVPSVASRSACSWWSSRSRGPPRR